MQEENCQRSACVFSGANMFRKLEDQEDDLPWIHCAFRMLKPDLLRPLSTVQVSRRSKTRTFFGVSGDVAWKNTYTWDVL